MLFLFRSAPEVEKRIHSKLFRKFWRSRGTKEPAYITVIELCIIQYEALWRKFGGMSVVALFSAEADK